MCGEKGQVVQEINYLFTLGQVEALTLVDVGQPTRAAGLRLVNALLLTAAE